MTLPPPLIPPNYDKESRKAKHPRDSENLVARRMDVAGPRNGHTPEGRQRLSELAKQRWKDGGFKKLEGTRKKRSGPRKKSGKRINTMVAEAARQDKVSRQIIDVFKDAIHPSQPTHLRIKAVETWLRVEAEDAKLMLREADSESQSRDRAELLGILSEKLTNGHSAMLLKKQLAQQTGMPDAAVIEGHADDISGD